MRFVVKPVNTKQWNKIYNIQPKLIFDFKKYAYSNEEKS